MRHRRAERCVHRAEAAIEAGQDDHAREALAEARALNPESPGFEALKARIDQRRAASAAAITRRARRLKLSVAAAALLAALGTFTFLGFEAAESPPAHASDPQQDGAGSPDNTPVATASARVSEESAAPKVVPTDGRIESSPAVVDQPSDQPPPLPVVVPPQAVEAKGSVQTPEAAPERLATSRSSSSLPANEPPLPPVRDVEPEVRLPQPTTIDALNATGSRPATVDRLPSGLPSAPAPEPVAPPPTPVEERVVRAAEPDDQRVRAVLAQFEAAYSSLNAAAARAVWPSVDERTLARAFANLDSQRVSLGNCDVRIEGASAHAECTGTTSWTPRIGGGGRTEARRWSFDLQSRDGVWQIVQAQAR